MASRRGYIAYSIELRNSPLSVAPYFHNKLNISKHDSSPVVASSSQEAIAVSSDKVGEQGERNNYRRIKLKMD